MGTPGPDKARARPEMLLATELCFGILGRKQERNPEANCGSVHHTGVSTCRRLPPMLYTEAHESPVKGQKGEEKRDTS